VNVGIHGQQRSGKTTLLVWLLMLSWRLGKQVYANFGLRFPDVPGLKPPKPLDVRTLVNLELEFCDIGIDEAQAWFDSRTSPSLANRVMSYFMYQSEKRGVDIFYVAHEPDLLERRIRRNLMVQYLCSWLGDPGRPSPRDAIYVLQLCHGIEGIPPLTEFVLWAPPLYPYFDTRERIPLEPTIQQKLAKAYGIKLDEPETALEQAREVGRDIEVPERVASDALNLAQNILKLREADKREALEKRRSGAQYAEKAVARTRRTR